MKFELLTKDPKTRARRGRLHTAHGMIETPISDIGAPYPQAFLLARHGKLALEEYFFGFDDDRVHES